MRLIFSFFLVCLISLMPGISRAYDPNAIVSVDSRIKTFIYNVNEIYSLKFKVGYQAIIQFSIDEEIELISVGDPYPWKITPINKNLFIEPVEPGIRTNMTVITNKRMYLFEIQSDVPTSIDDTDIVYIARFFYPSSNYTNPIPQPATKFIKPNTPPVVQSQQPSNATSISNVPSKQASQKVNIMYSFAGEQNDSTPIEIFDDKIKTYMRFKSDVDYSAVKIYAVSSSNKKTTLPASKFNNFLAMDGVYQRLIVELAGKTTEVYNDLALSTETAQLGQDQNQSQSQIQIPRPPNDQPQAQSQMNRR